MKELHKDPYKGSTWYFKAETSPVEFSFGDKIVTVNGCFYHVYCKHFSIFGDPFPSFTCLKCASIPILGDFKKRVIRKSRTVDKRGSRSTANGIQASLPSIVDWLCVGTKNKRLCIGH